MLITGLSFLAALWGDLSLLVDREKTPRFLCIRGPLAVYRTYTASQQSVLYASSARMRGYGTIPLMHPFGGLYRNTEYMRQLHRLLLLQIDTDSCAVVTTSFLIPILASSRGLGKSSISVPIIAKSPNSC